MNGVPSAPKRTAPCRHDSTRLDGMLGDHCLFCGERGYWHQGHRHDKAHPSGVVLVRLDCPPEVRREADDCADGCTAHATCRAPASTQEAS